MKNKKSSVRVLQVIGCMDCGGTENMIMNLYRNIDKSIIQFDFVVHTKRKCFFDDEIHNLGGVIYHCPKYKAINHFLYCNWWKSFFNKQTNFKIIHGHIGSTASIYLKIAKKFGLYTIAHSHGTKMSLLYKFFSYPTRFIADMFFACSLEAGIQRFGKRICSDSNIFLVFKNAINTKDFLFNPSVRKSVIKKYNLDGNTVLITVGRMVKVKNPYGIIDIFYKFLSLNSKSILLWCGNGPLFKKIKQKTKLLGIENKILFLGIRKDVNFLLQASDVFILPSYSEGLPVSGIEAQASGVPCIFGLGVPRETDITGNCSFLNIKDSDLWVKQIELYSKFERKNTKNYIIESGFDIYKTSEWLTNFYLEKY